MSDESSAALPLIPSPPEAPSPPAKPVSRIRWGIHLAIMAALPVVAGILGTSNRQRGPAFAHDVRGLLIVCGVEVLVFAAIYGLAWLASRATRDALLLRWRPGYWVVPLGIVYSLAIRMVVGVAAVIGVTMVVLIAKGSPADVPKFFEAHRPQVETLVDLQALSNDPAYYWLAVILVSFVIGGLREELWRSASLAGLRSLWPRAFASQGGGMAGAAVIAIFFGAGHLPQGMLAVMMAALIGFLLGALMILHRSVWPSVIAHGLFDATSLALIPWAMSQLHGPR